MVDSEPSSGAAPREYERPSMRQFVVTDTPLCIVNDESGAVPVVAQTCNCRVQCACVCDFPCCVTACQCPNPCACPCSNVAVTGSPADPDGIAQDIESRRFRLVDPHMFRREAFGGLLCHPATFAITVANRTAADIIELLDGTRSTQGIARLVSERYERANDEVLPDVSAFLATLFTMSFVAASDGDGR